MQSKFKLLVSLFYLFLFAYALVAQETPTPTLTADNIAVTIKNYTPGKPLNLFESQTLTAVIDQNVPSPGTVILKCEDENVCTAQKDETDSSKWLITVQGNSNNLTTKIKVARSIPLANYLSPSIEGQNKDQIDVKVYKITPLGSLTTIHINESISLGKLLDLSAGMVTDSLSVDRENQVATYENNTIKGVVEGEGKFLIKPKIGDFADGNPFALPIKVVPAELTVKILNKNIKLKGNVNDRVRIAAEVYDAQGNRLSKETNEIKWRLRNSSDEEKINRRELGNGELEIDILKPSDTLIILEAKIKDKDITDSIALFAEPELNIVGFGNIEMRLNMIDERTAQDLFGGQSIADYMVAKLRIFNRIPANQNGGPSSSILFFSEGLEVNVGLEKKVLDSKRSGSKETEKWQPITPQDVQYINSWVYIKDLDETYIDYYIRKTITCDGVKERLKIKTCELDTSSIDRLQYFYEKNNCLDEACRNQVAQKNWTPFRPHAFLIVASTHERRSERSVRERTLRIANGLVSAASFATAFASPTNNTGYNFGFDKYSNLLVPAFEQLFPSRREVQRKNILDMALQPYEEISFGRELSKMVFIPRKSIPGILPNYDVRIVTVSVSKIKAEVSIIQKQKVATP